MSEDWFLDKTGSATTDTPDLRPYQHSSPAARRQPSGPYPVGGAGTTSTALVRLPSAPIAQVPFVWPRDRTGCELEAWEGPFEGQALRRAARLADRVVVLVSSGAMSAFRLNGIQNRLGRERGIGYIVVGLPEELLTLPDRVGDVAAFWRA